MNDWYYHDRGQGRVGPLDDDAMRARYVSRQIALDTLVWRQGMPEWQPLERVSEQLALHTVAPDLSQPPPVPATASVLSRSGISGTSAAAMQRPQAPLPRRGLSGCAIAAIVCVAMIPLLGILAAIALPAYQDYVNRAKAAQARTPAAFDADALADADAQVRDLLARAMRLYYAKQRQCPDEFEFESILVRASDLAGRYAIEPAKPTDPAAICAYRVTFQGLGPRVEDKAALYETMFDGDEVRVVCSTRELAVDARPPQCGDAAAP